MEITYSTWQWSCQSHKNISARLRESNRTPEAQQGAAEGFSQTTTTMGTLHNLNTAKRLPGYKRSIALCNAWDELEVSKVLV